MNFVYPIMNDKDQTAYHKMLQLLWKLSLFRYGGIVTDPNTQTTTILGNGSVTW